MIRSKRSFISRRLLARRHRPGPHMIQDLVHCRNGTLITHTRGSILMPCFDRQTLRRTMLQQLDHFSQWSGAELLELIRRDDGFVRQIYLCREPELVLNLRLEIAPDQTSCKVGQTAIWVSVGDGVRIEGAEMVVDGDRVLIGNRLGSFGGE